MKHYVVVGIHKENKTVVGEIEHSFSMGKSETNVRVYDSPKGRSSRDVDFLKKKISRYNKSWPEYTWRVYRAGSNKCPVKLKWNKGWQRNKRNMEFIPK